MGPNLRAAMRPSVQAKAVKAAAYKAAAYAVLAALVFALILPGPPAPAAAHEQKAAITRVLFNPRTKNIEIMHRFLLHDAEHAVKQIFGGQANILEDETSRQRFADYVHRRFAMARADGTPIALSLIGQEIDGRYLWVYEEAPTPPGLKGLEIRHAALRDIWPRQINLVNVERGDDLWTVTFTGAATALAVDFSAAD